MKFVAVSGGMDPVHFGHTRLFEAAAEYGNVVVILNTDEWLKRKKGYVFMPWKERAEVLLAMRYVYNVIPARDDDGSVCETLKHLKPHFFANGGDRIPENTPEVRLCHELGISMLWNVGGKKVSSSTELVRKSNG